MENGNNYNGNPNHNNVGSPGGGPALAMTMPPQGGMMQVKAQQQMAEIQARVLMAYHRPRDENAAHTRIMKACGRLKVAENAEYSYHRGGEAITGPTIRLAEVIAQSWPNFKFGFRVLDQTRTKSTVEAFAWDLEMNTDRTLTFEVSHERHTKRGKYLLTDPRDIYEMISNYAQRRVRMCILALIPIDIVEDAIEACRETQQKGMGKTREDRVRKMVLVFDKIGVKQDEIEKRLGHSVDKTTDDELAELIAVYNALRDGITSIADEFRGGKKAPTSTNGTPADEELAEAIVNDEEAQSQEEQPPPEETGELFEWAPDSLDAFRNRVAAALGCDDVDNKGLAYFCDDWASSVLKSDTGLEALTIAQHAACVKALEVAEKHKVTENGQGTVA